MSPANPRILPWEVEGLPKAAQPEPGPPPPQTFNSFPLFQMTAAFLGPRPGPVSPRLVPTASSPTPVL